MTVAGCRCVLCRTNGEQPIDMGFLSLPLEIQEEALRACAPLCAHCLSPQQGYATVGDAPLCHPDEGMDCYTLVTVQGHSLPCDRYCNG